MAFPANLQVPLRRQCKKLWEGVSSVAPRPTFIRALNLPRRINISVRADGDGFPAFPQHSNGSLHVKVAFHAPKV